MEQRKVVNIMTSRFGEMVGRAGGGVPVSLRSKPLRPDQVGKVEDIVAAFSRSPVVVVEAPTGAGKTKLADSVASCLSGGAIHLTKTLVLQDQIEADFGKDITVIRGKRNFKTLLKPNEFPGVSCDNCTFIGRQEELDEDGNIIVVDGQDCNLCPERRRCPYVIARDKACNSKLAGANYSYFLQNRLLLPFWREHRDGCRETERVEGLLRQGIPAVETCGCKKESGKWGLIIIDEADDIRNVLLEQMTYSVPAMVLDYIGKSGGVGAGDKEWTEEILGLLREKYSSVFTECGPLMEGLKSSPEYVSRGMDLPLELESLVEEWAGKSKSGMLMALGFGVRSSAGVMEYGENEEIIETDSFRNTVETFCSRMEMLVNIKHVGHQLVEVLAGLGRSWALGCSDEGGCVWIPVYIDPKRALEMLWSRGSRFLVMSATILDAPGLLLELGCPDPDSSIFLQYDSPFLASNRQIHFNPTSYPITYRTKEEVMPEVLFYVEQICQEAANRGERTAILCQSYDWQYRIKEHLWSIGMGRRLYVHGRNHSDKQDVISRFRKSASGILLAVNQERGLDLDGDSCRNLVVVKMPMPGFTPGSLDWTACRLKGSDGWDWYNLETFRALIQGTGRSCRNMSDWSNIFILDAAFVELFHKMNKRGLVPSWWSEALVDHSAEKLLAL